MQKKLVKFLHGLKAKVNLIPMNPHPGAVNMEATDFEQMYVSFKIFSNRSFLHLYVYSRGPDVSAACGQLATKEKMN